MRASLWYVSPDHEGSPMTEKDPQDAALEHVSPSRRRFLKRLAVGSAVAVPVVSSFSMSGVSPNFNIAGAANS